MPVLHSRKGREAAGYLVVGARRRQSPTRTVGSWALAGGGVDLVVAQEANGKRKTYSKQVCERRRAILPGPRASPRARYWADLSFFFMLSQLDANK